MIRGKALRPSAFAGEILVRMEKMTGHSSIQPLFSPDVLSHIFCVSAAAFCFVSGFTFKHGSFIKLVGLYCRYLKFCPRSWMHTALLVVQDTDIQAFCITEKGPAPKPGDVTACCKFGSLHHWVRHFVQIVFLSVAKAIFYSLRYNLSTYRTARVFRFLIIVRH